MKENDGITPVIVKCSDTCTTRGSGNRSVPNRDGGETVELNELVNRTDKK